MAPDWLPDWREQAICILACGPSARSANLRAIEACGLPVIAVKEAYTLLRKPPALVYGCDGAWWRYNRALPKHKCLKVTHATQLSEDFPGVFRFVKVLPTVDELVMDDPGRVVGGGGCSGFQSLNLALHCGARRILLVGFDMGEETHFYGANTWQGASNPNGINFQRWLRAFDRAARQIADMDVEVVNGSMTSAMRGFRREPITETLNRWQSTDR